MNNLCLLFDGQPLNQSKHFYHPFLHKFSIDWLPCAKTKDSYNLKYTTLGKLGRKASYPKLNWQEKSNKKRLPNNEQPSTMNRLTFYFRWITFPFTCLSPTLNE